MLKAVGLFAMVILVGCTRGPAAAKHADEQSVRAANTAYDKALIDADAAALNRLYSDDFTIIDDDGEIHNRQNQIDFMTKEVDLLKAEADQVRVTMLGGDAALVTGRLTGRYRYGGKESDFVERYTSVWVRRDGTWRVKHEHASLQPQATGQPSGQ